MQDRMELEIEKNKELIKKYPFLVPSYIPKDLSGYDYEFTQLDNMPKGWRMAFGEKMCEEIKQSLEKGGLLNDYRILEIKEKYGFLRWYDFGGTDETDRIISKYERISERTCVRCGAPATKISHGWISPWCDKCAAELKSCNVFTPIEEYLKEDGDESDLS